MIKTILYMIDCHKFFVRKSQHYILGNWYEYVQDDEKKLDYILRFPGAYFRFMKSSYIHRKMEK